MQAHYELCALIPTVIVTKSKEAMAEIDTVLQQKWDHERQLPSTFESDLFLLDQLLGATSRVRQSFTNPPYRHTLACSSLISENFQRSLRRSLRCPTWPTKSQCMDTQSRLAENQENDGVFTVWGVMIGGVACL